MLVNQDITERTFDESKIQNNTHAIAALLATGEGWIDEAVRIAYGLSQQDFEIILADTGTPAGFHPLLAGYDALPGLPAELELPELPAEVVDYLAAHERVAPTAAKLA